MDILFIGMEKTINQVGSMSKSKNLHNQRTSNYLFSLLLILIGSHHILVIFPL